MTNPGIPPVLSQAQHEQVADRVRQLKDELDELLEEIDSALEVPAVPAAISRALHPSAA